ncbi:winged helix DNA-binding protein [Roseivivax sediminis]|uniref:Predicted transcription regulator, contains HTH domain, MarR family n=1 Tax=Roseivivax sediminis TaxID=936889 RepID=A0A1I2D328_9RHOB|nr:winged helix DNA-binding protein [Roseivivax sediminis]SFE74926.1 Predicted transcription regulator, contains HTH domain, MarR family [Roseivivax sediminis]
MSDGNARIGPVVSSAHLAASALPELSELEYALTMANHAFQRWIVRCMDAAGAPGMSPLEVLIVHLVNHRDRAKTQSDIRLVLHVEDAHLVTYAVRKLSERGLVTTARKGKDKTVEITEEGTAVCTRYREVRESLLIELARETGWKPEEMSRLAALLRAMSGNYDHAARAATTL